MLARLRQHPLASANYRRFWLSQLVSIFGTTFSDIGYVAGEYVEYHLQYRLAAHSQESVVFRAGRAWTVRLGQFYGIDRHSAATH